MNIEMTTAKVMMGEEERRKCNKELWLYVRGTMDDGTVELKDYV